MRFGEAHWLQLLWLLPLFAALVWWRLRQREADLRTWCGPGLWARMVPARQRWAPYVKALMLLSAIFFLIVAAARPQIGSRVRTVTRQGIDVVVALDVSQSMLAEDLAPNRITRAQQEIQSLLERLRGDRVGLVAFAGDAFVQCPLTLDYAAARLFLRLMNTDLVPVPGTGLARAIEVATGAFEEEETQFKALVLITDGEDHEGRMRDAAEEAKKQGVRIYAVGIGSEQGEPIPIRDAGGQVKDYKRDENGEVILTRQDPAALMEICELTGGQYFDGKAGGLALDRLYDAISSLEEREMEGGVVTQYEDRYGYFAAVAFLLLILEWFWSERTRIRRTLASVSSAAALLFVFLPGMTLLADTAKADDAGRRHYEDGDYEAAREAYEAYSAEHPEDPRGYYNLGTTLHQAGELNPAQFALRRATAESDPRVQAQALYNLGNTQAKMGDLQGARDSYREALKIDPTDRDTKINLEIINRLLEQAPPDSSSQPQQQQGQNSQDPQEQSDEQQDSQDQNSQDQQSQDQESQERQNPQESDSENDAEEQQQSSEGSESPEDQEQDSQNPQERQSDQDQQQGEEPPSEDPQAAKQEDLKISPEEARRLLEALGQQEQQIQAERMKARAKDVKVEKDW